MSAVTMSPAATGHQQSHVPPGRRSWWRMAAGALVVAAAAAGFAVYGTAATGVSPVLVVAAPVAMGETITAADVQVAQVRLGPGVRAVPGSQAELVVGRPAAVPLVEGMLLAPQHVGPAAMPREGQLLVAVAVPLVPAGVAAGSPVRVVVTPGGGAGGGAVEPSDEQTSGVVTEVVSATVVEVGPADGTGARVVSLQLPVEDGQRVAVAAAAGRVSLVAEATG